MNLRLLEQKKFHKWTMKWGGNTFHNYFLLFSLLYVRPAWLFIMNFSKICNKLLFFFHFETFSYLHSLVSELVEWCGSNRKTLISRKSLPTIINYSLLCVFVLLLLLVLLLLFAPCFSLRFPWSFSSGSIYFIRPSWYNFPRRLTNWLTCRSL